MSLASLCVSVVSPFLLLSSIAWYHSLIIYLLKNILLVSSLSYYEQNYYEQSSIVVLWIIVSLGKYPGVQLLDYMVNPSYKKLGSYFSGWHTILHSHQPCGTIPVAQHSCQHSGIAGITYFSHSNKYVVICHHGFNSLNHFNRHFPKKQYMLLHFFKDCWTYIFPQTILTEKTILSLRGYWSTQGCFLCF